MKVILLSTAALAAISPGAAFAPPSPHSHPRRPRDRSGARALRSARSLALPDPYRNLPWNAEREDKRRVRRLEVENAALFRDLGLPVDATYEDVAAKTEHLIGLTEGLPKNEALKRKVRIEISRDKIYQIRLNERISGVRAEQEDAARVSKLEDEGLEGLIAMTSDSVDDIVKPKKKLRIPLLSPLYEYGLSVWTPPDEKWRGRQAVIWGASTLACLVAPPLTESFARINWLPAGGMIGYRGMPVPDGGGNGYNPFRGKRNKKHQVVAMGIALFGWTVAKLAADKAVRSVPAMAASRSANWFKFAITQAAMFGLVLYTKTYKEGEEGKDLMI